MRIARRCAIGKRKCTRDCRGIMAVILIGNTTLGDSFECRGAVLATGDITFEVLLTVSELLQPYSFRTCPDAQQFSGAAKLRTGEK
jgi:hypothetical protein